MSGSSSDDKINAMRRALSGKNALTLDQLEFIIDLEKDSRILGKRTPGEWKNFLEQMGFKTEPLGKGHLKGVKFEDGGGFRIHYRGDGYLQYHPRGSHHGDEYYKISSAKEGIKRYSMDGSEKK